MNRYKANQHLLAAFVSEQVSVLFLVGLEQLLLLPESRLSPHCSAHSACLFRLHPSALSNHLVDTVRLAISQSTLSPCQPHIPRSRHPLHRDIHNNLHQHCDINLVLSSSQAQVLETILYVNLWIHQIVPKRNRSHTFLLE